MAATWKMIAELAMGGLAGVIGTLVRMAHPQRRKIGLCLLWEIPAGLGFGAAAYGLAPLFGVSHETARFAVAYMCGYLGQAAVHDAVVAWAATKLAMSPDAVRRVLERQQEAEAQIREQEARQRRELEQRIAGGSTERPQ